LSKPTANSDSAVTKSVSIEDLPPNYQTVLENLITGNIPYVNLGNSQKIAWDGSGMHHLDVYQRNKFTTNWHYMGSTNTNSFMINGLPPGVYEFGVEGIDEYEDSTGWCDSTDESASPKAWYLFLNTSLEADINADGYITEEEAIQYTDKWFVGLISDESLSLLADYLKNGELLSDQD
jgi:hypothetical protein